MRFISASIFNFWTIWNYKEVPVFWFCLIYSVVCWIISLDSLLLFRLYHSDFSYFRSSIHAKGQIGNWYNPERHRPALCAASKKCSQSSLAFCTDSLSKCAVITIFLFIISSKASIIPMASISKILELKYLYALACLASSAAITSHIWASFLLPDCFARVPTLLWEILFAVFWKLV